MPGVLILGSSHVNHFKTFLKEENKLDFELQPPVEIHLFGISGGLISRSSHVRRLEEEIQTVQPDALIIHIGGNDLDDKEHEPNRVAETCQLLVSVCDLFATRYNLKLVTVMQLMPRQRTRHWDPELYNNRVIDFNRLLKQIYETLKSCVIGTLPV